MRSRQPAGRWRGETCDGAAAVAALVDELRRLGWGRAEEVVVVAGVPVIATGTKLFRRVRRDHVNDAAVVRPPPPGVTRPLHRRHGEFLAYCRAVGDGVISRVEVADGLPVYWH